MNPQHAAWQRGETIALAIYIDAGDPADLASVTGVSAKLRRLAPGSVELAADAALVATFDVAARAASADLAAGWTLTIDKDASALIAPGRYLADARFEIGGAVVTSDPIVVVIEEPATVTAGPGAP